MGRTLYKSLIRQKIEKALANNSQKTKQRESNNYFDVKTKKEEVKAINSKKRNGVILTEVMPEKEFVFPTEEFIGEILKYIKTAKQSKPQDSNYRTYELQYLRVKPILENLKTDVLKEIIKFEHCLNLIDAPQFIDGNIIEFDKRILFKLDLKAKARYSIVLDRKGDTVNFDTFPTRPINDQEQKMMVLKLLDPVKMNSLKNRFYNNLIGSIDLKTEENILSGVFGLNPIGKGTFVNGRIKKKNNQVFFEIVLDSYFKFTLIMDLYGNYFDISENDCLSDRMDLAEETFQRDNFSTTINLFHSKIDCLL